MIDEQKFADGFDLALFRLIERASNRADSARVGSPECQAWNAIAGHLIAAWCKVRPRMSEQDRRLTA